MSRPASTNRRSGSVGSFLREIEHHVEQHPEIAPRPKVADMEHEPLAGDAGVLGELGAEPERRHVDAIPGNAVGGRDFRT